MRVASFLLCGLLGGCSAILGVEPGTYEPPTADGGAEAPERDASRPAREPEAATSAATPDGGTCRDTQTNTHHCGACGHDCLGGACEGGRCLPSIVASGPDNASALVLGPDQVFWATNGGDLLRAPIVSGTATPDTLFRSSLLNISGNLVVIDDYVYFADRVGERVVRCPLTGGCAAETALAPIETPFALATSNGALYASNGQSGPSVYRCKTPPCASSPELFVTGEAGLYLLAASGDSLVWSILGSASRDQLRTTRTSSFSPRTLFSGTGTRFGLGSLLVRDDDVHFIFDGELRTSSLKTTSNRLLAKVVPSGALERQSDDLFFTDYYGGMILRHSASVSTTDEPVVVASDQTRPKAIVAHPSGLYWLAGKNVMRLVR